MIEIDKIPIVRENKKYTGYIYYDEDTPNPRNVYSFLGHFKMFHSRYDFSDENLTQFKNFDDFIDYLTNYKGIIVYLPVYMYDHGGVTINTVSFNDRWDSGLIGYIYATDKDIKKWFNIEEVTAKTIDYVTEILSQEIKALDKWVRGDVFSYIVICDDTQEQVDYDTGHYDLEEVKSILSRWQP